MKNKTFFFFSYEGLRSVQEFPQTANVLDLAGYVCTILYGLRVLAANGDGKAELKRVTDMALKMLPI